MLSAQAFKGKFRAQKIKEMPFSRTKKAWVAMITIECKNRNASNADRGFRDFISFLMDSSLQRLSNKVTQ